jgi:hypothetical protein
MGFALEVPSILRILRDNSSCRFKTSPNTTVNAKFLGGSRLATHSSDPPLRWSILPIHSPRREIRVETATLEL